MCLQVRNIQEYEYVFKSLLTHGTIGDSFVRLLALSQKTESLVVVARGGVYVI
jgi:hypothetical protein